MQVRGENGGLAPPKARNTADRAPVWRANNRARPRCDRAAPTGARAHHRVAPAIAAPSAAAIRSCSPVWSGSEKRQFFGFSLYRQEQRSCSCLPFDWLNNALISSICDVASSLAQIDKRNAARYASFGLRRANQIDRLERTRCRSRSRPAALAVACQGSTPAFRRHACGFRDTAGSQSASGWRQSPSVSKHRRRRMVRASKRLPPGCGNPLRREPELAQISPLAERHSPLDSRPDFWEARSCSNEFPTSALRRMRHSPPSGGFRVSRVGAPLG